MKKLISLIALFTFSLLQAQNYSPSTLSYFNLLFPNIAPHNEMAEISVDQTTIDTNTIVHFTKNTNGAYLDGYEIDLEFNDTAFWSCGITGNVNTIIIKDPVLLSDTLQMEEVYADAQYRDTLIVAYADTGGFGISKYQEFEMSYGSNGYTELIFYFYNNSTREEFLKFTPTYDGSGMLDEVDVSVSFGGINLPAQTLVYDYQGLALQNVYVIDRFSNNDTLEKVKPSLNPAYQITRLNFMEKDSVGEWVVYNIMDFSNQGTSVGMSERKHASFSLFPNPARSLLNIRTEQELDLMFYSSQGQLVKTYHIRNGGQLNVADLAPGVYLVKAKSPSGTQSIRFVKN